MCSKKSLKFRSPTIQHGSDFEQVIVPLKWSDGIFQPQETFKEHFGTGSCSASNAKDVGMAVWRTRESFISSHGDRVTAHEQQGIFSLS